MKRIAHIDLNAFFCQCEILKNPSLKGKAIAVGSIQRRGVISTSSYEARKKGVHSALPTSIARSRCPELILIDGNYSLYQKYSNMFFSYLESRFPILEKASIDECYIDMTKEMMDVGDEEAYLFDLQMEIFHKTRLKCSIGLSYNRFLAKMASDMKKPLGLTIIQKEDIPRMIHPLPIDKFFGIGKKTTPQLIDAGITTIGDLARSDDDNVRKILGSSFDYFRNEANGIASDIVDNSAFDPKSISAERTFPDDVTDYDEAMNMIRKCVDEVCADLKKHQKLCECLSLKLRDNHFVTRSKRISLAQPTMDSSILFTYAMRIFDEFYKDEPLRLIGVSAEKVLNAMEKKKDETDKLIREINQNLTFGGKIIKGEDLG